MSDQVRLVTVAACSDYRARRVILLHDQQIPGLLDHAADVALLPGRQTGDTARQHLARIGRVAMENMRVVQTHFQRREALGGALGGLGFGAHNDVFSTKRARITGSSGVVVNS